MERPDKWYTARAFWVDGFKRDPEGLEWFLRAWRITATWLVEGRKEACNAEEERVFAALPSRIEETPHERVGGTVASFTQMTELLVTWSDSTIHADSNVLLRLVDHVWKLRWDLNPKARKALVRDWRVARHVWRRLWLQMEIRRRPAKRKGRNKYLDHVRELLQDGQVLDGPDVATALGVRKDYVPQIMRRLREHGFGKEKGKRGYRKLTDTKS